jgi:hypothetical protein
MECIPMPFYEFFSPDTNKIYTFRAANMSWRLKTPRCPDGKDFLMERRVSQFSITGKVKEDTADDPFAGIDDSRMEALFNDMEHEMGSIDDANPDPKQLGRFMRKLTDLMGNKTPEAMRELVAQLEAGVDPQSLEEKFGDLAPDPNNPDAELGSAADELWQTVKKRFSGLKQPRRDPKLYDMAEWV